MAMHIVGNPRDHGGDDNPPEHGRDTAIYQELQEVRRKLDEWVTRNKNDFFNSDMEVNVSTVEHILEEISDELNTPL